MKTNILIPIGKRIGEIRRSHNITQETLADKPGVSPKHISHTECGTSSLSLKNLMEFCEIFDCSLNYIIFGTKKDSILSQLPVEIVNILSAGNADEKDRLNRYLQMYLELTQKQD